MSSFVVIIPEEGEIWAALQRRVLEAKGSILLVVAGRDEELAADGKALSSLLDACKGIKDRVKIATKSPKVIAEAKRRGIQTLERTKVLKQLLAGHEKQEQVLRVFSPQLWKQQLQSNLQRMGLLSVPRLRIYFLVGFSSVLFFFVILRLLPSAEITIEARQETLSQTMNVFLVQSGATADLSEHVRRQPLLPVSVSVHQSLTFDDISKEFIGTSAEVELTVFNKTSEEYSLRTGTRFTNQAGMVFRSLHSVIIPAGKDATVKTRADDKDLFDQIIGERGNVPAGVKWEIPGLSTAERAKVYAENRKAAQGGSTAHRTVLKQEDLELARKRLEQELLAAAKELIAEELIERTASGEEGKLRVLAYEELTKTVYSDVVLPEQFLGQQEISVPVEGTITYTVYAYDAAAILSHLSVELAEHVREGRQLLKESLKADRMTVVVIDYADDLSWIKLTVDLTGTEQYVLDSLSPAGAIFAKRLREKVIGVRKDEALRIIKNMPEVERVEISLWPPWSRTLPPIPSHITVTSE
jgi:hypothetical protein